MKLIIQSQPYEYMLTDMAKTVEAFDLQIKWIYDMPLGNIWVVITTAPIIGESVYWLKDCES